MKEKLLNSDHEEVPEEESVERNCCKLITYRLMMRAVMVGVICVLMYFLPIAEITLEYCEYISGFALWKQILFFTVGASSFHTVMPTGYLPTVLSGLVFAEHFFVGWAVSYISVNLGSMFNMLWVRAIDAGYVKRLLKKKLSAFAFLNKMLVLKPFQTILLFRLPYLYVGTVNYIMAFSDVDFRTYVFGNAVGYISGSALFTALGRSCRNVLEMISKTHQLSRTEILIESAICITIGLCTVFAIMVAKSVIQQERVSAACQHWFMEIQAKKYGERCHTCYKMQDAGVIMKKCSICSMNECMDCECGNNDKNGIKPGKNCDDYVLLQ